MKKKSILFIVSFISILLLWFGYQASLRLAQHLPQPIRQWLSLAHFKTRNVVADLTDAFYPQTYWHGNHAKKLKNLSLILSPTDIKSLEKDARRSVELGYNSKQSASNQKIYLQYEGIQYPANISFHGGGANDFVFNKNDYNVKIEDVKTVAGYASFNLFNPSVHNWLVPLLSGRVAAKLNLLVNDQFPVLVKINNRTSGVYLLEEKINGDFLEKRNLTQAQVIKLRDEIRLPHRINTIALDAHILSGLDWEIANVDPLKDNNPIVLGRLDQFYKAIKARDFKIVSQFINLDYWARFDAYRELLATDHDTAGANFIMIYLPEENKFYPVARSEGGLGELSISGGNTLKSFNNYDPHLAEQFDYSRLFILLNIDPEFRLLKYRYLNQLANQFESLRQEFNLVYDQYSRAMLYDNSDEASVWQKKQLFNNYLKTIEHNLAIIKQELSFAQLAINIINHGNQATVEIIPDALMPISFDWFELEFEDGSVLDVSAIVKNKIIMATITPELNVIPTTFVFNFPAKQPVKSLNVQAKNQITGTAIKAVYSAVGSN